MGMCLVGVAVDAAPSHPLIPLEGGWEYRWGDSPFDESDVPLWAVEVRGWNAIDYPSNPPDRDGRKNVWYRIRLPDERIRDPRLYITSVDIIVQIYLQGELIYSFGEFDESGRGSFRGWPWHLVSLPEDFAGRYLRFRIFSDYRDIGLWGNILLGSGCDQMKRIFGRDIVRMIIGILSLAICFIFAVLFFLNRGDRSSLYLSLITFGLWVAILALFVIMAALAVYGMLAANSLLPWSDDVTYLIGLTRPRSLRETASKGRMDGSWHCSRDWSAPWGSGGFL